MSAIGKETKKQIKGELESLLSQFGSNDDTIGDDIVNDQFREIIQAPPIDFEEMNAKFNEKAKTITDSIFDYYVSIGILESHDYLRIKKELDDGNIQTIFFQIKTLKFAIEKLMQSINVGTAGAREFEVLGQLQDKLSNTLKIQANYILFLEDSYKKVKSEVEDKGLDTGENVQKIENKKNKDEYIISAGTKNVMKELSGEPRDIKFEIGTSNLNLTDPRQKGTLMEEVGLSHLKVVETDEDDYSDAVAEMI